MAGIADRRLARDLRNAAPLHPDHRQDSSGAHAMAEPFLARHALCHRARADHLADTRRHSQLSDRPRLHRSSLADFDQRRRNAPVCADWEIRCGFLHGDHGFSRRSRHSRRNPRDAQRIAGADPVFARQPTCLLRSGRSAAVVSDPSQCRSGVQAFPHRLPRQGEPSAFLLGQF